MQLFLQPITEYDCERTVPKCGRFGDFWATGRIARLRKGCEPRNLSVSFAR
jgi:hypothetical protein